MSMNLLPDDCLLHLFNLIHDTHTLFRCLRVCRRWNHLVRYRLARAERLLDEEVIDGTQLDDKSLFYDTNDKPLVEQVLTNILIKSPKLKIISVGAESDDFYEDPRWLQKSVNRLFEHVYLEGLLLSSRTSEEIEAIPPTVKYLFCDDTSIRTGYYPRVKHLIVEDDIFYDSIHRFPNLEWLKLCVVTNPYEWFDTACNNRHVFRNLKMLEIDTTWEDEEPAEQNLAVRFIDICPQLESAHIRIPIDQKVPDDNFRHENLTNLVITLKRLEQLKGSLENLLILLKRFPNIKHLAIKYMYHLNRNVSDDPADNEYESELKNMLHVLICDVLRSRCTEEDEPVSNNIENDGSDDDEDNEENDEEKDEKSDEEPQPLIIKICRLLPPLIAHQLKKLVLLDMRNIVRYDRSCREFVQAICRSQRRSIKFYYGKTQDDKIKRDWPELFDVSRDSSAFKFMANHFLRDYQDIRQSVCPNEISDV